MVRMIEHQLRNLTPGNESAEAISNYKLGLLNFNFHPRGASIQIHDKEGMSARLCSLGVKHTDKLQGNVCR